jgi:hypothetical protein
MTALTLHDYAADIAAIIEQEGRDPVAVVGHAYGHFVAPMVATDRPDLVRVYRWQPLRQARCPRARTHCPSRQKCAKRSRPSRELCRTLRAKPRAVTCLIGYH